MTAPAPRKRITRHAPVDRLYHWLMAVSVILLLATGFLPLLGLQFDWVAVHWIAGVCLFVLVSVHIVRALFWQNWREMWISRRDLTDARAHAEWLGGGTPPPRAGKYLLSQKLYHLAVSIVLLATIVTGLMMLSRIDSPLWARNPYWLSDQVWGVVYVVHGLAALASITLLMLHVYFAFRPEKLQFLRSMVAGWITAEEHRRYHDPERWPGSDPTPPAPESTLTRSSDSAT